MSASLQGHQLNFLPNGHDHQNGLSEIHTSGETGSNSCSVGSCQCVLSQTYFNSSAKASSNSKSCNSDRLSQEMPVITDELIAKVENGEDQRTYVMVRNIPSNFCKEQLINEF